MKRFGLAAIFKFVDAGASAGMARASKKAGLLKRSLGGVKQGMMRVSTGATGMISRIGILAGGVGIGAAIRAFAKFDGQMKTVHSVLKDISAKDMKIMTDRAKQLGETTQFTAVEAGKAMEKLARSGLDANRVLGAIGPTLNVAAAAGLKDLGVAASIVADNMKTFGMNTRTTEKTMESATRVADVLSFVTAKTNTNIVELQEGMKLVIRSAGPLEVSFENAAASLGVLADMGLRGSLGATAFNNALLQMAKNTKRGRIGVKGFHVQMAKTEDGGVDIVGTMRNIGKGLAKIPDVAKRATIAMKLLGLRGMAVPPSFNRAIADTQKMKDLFDGLGKNAAGVADQMRLIRAKSLEVKLKLLNSAIQGALINLGEMITKHFGLKGGIEGLTQGVSQLAKAFGFFVENPDKLDKNGVAIKGVKGKIAGLAQGVLVAIRDFKNLALKLLEIGEKLVGFIERFSEGGISGFTEMTIKATALVVVLGPVLMTLTSMVSLVGSIGKLSALAFGSKGLGLAGKALGGLKGAGGLLGKAAPLLGKAGLVGAAGAVGYGLGTLLDNAPKLFGSERNFSDMLAGTAGEGVTQDLTPAKDALVMDRASLAGAITSNMRGGLAGSVSPALGQGDPGRVTPPPAQNVDIGGEINISVPLTIDGRQVALAVAKTKLTDLERQGATPSPGDRSSMLQRGFTAAF